MPNTKKLVDRSEKTIAQYEGMVKNLSARRAQMTAGRASA